MVFRIYSVTDWYWHVQDVDRIWGSKAVDYLTPGTNPAWDDYQAFLTDGYLPVEVPTEPDMWRLLDHSVKGIWTATVLDFVDSVAGATHLMPTPAPSSTTAWFGGIGGKLVLPNVRSHLALPIGVPIEVKNVGNQDFEVVHLSGVSFTPPLALSPTDTARLTLMDNSTKDGLWSIQLITRSQTLAFASGILGRRLSAKQWRVTGRYVLMAADGTTKAMHDVYPVQPTLDISIVGAGGRYETAPYPSVFGAVGVYVIWGPGKDLTCFSAAGANDVWGVWARLPAGYTHACLVTIFEVDGAGNIPVGLSQNGNAISFDPVLVVNGDAYSNATPNKPLDLSPWAPHSTSVFFNVYVPGGAGAADFGMFAHTENKVFSYINAGNTRDSFEMPMNWDNPANLGKPMLYYACQGSATISAFIMGYRIAGVF